MAFTQFIENPRFNTEIRYGTVGGPEFSTDVTIVSSGAEHRNANWLDARGRWEIGDDLYNKEQIDQLTAFFRERRGRAGGFRFKDWSDWKADKVTGVVLEVPSKPGLYQLAKKYTNGIEVTYRPITKPVIGTLMFYEDGEPTDAQVSLGGIPQWITLMVTTAYASIGRYGIGSGAGNIDAIGFDYHTNRLNQNPSLAEGFLMEFLYLASQQGTSTDASKAAALLNTIQGAVLSEGTPPNRAALILTAYAAIGRTGFGTEPANVDIAGYRYWASLLSRGNVTYETFQYGFFTTVKNTAPKIPSANYQDEIDLATSLQTAYAGVTTTPAYYAYLVLTAYGAVGRIGFGNTAAQIDKAGYDFWLSALTENRVSPQNFISTFLNTTVQLGGPAATPAANMLANMGTNYQENLTYLAYGAIGRYDIGVGLQNIDQGGFDFWVGSLTTNPNNIPAFFSNFMESVNQHTTGIPIDYSDAIAKATQVTGMYDGAIAVDYTKGHITIGSTTPITGVLTWTGEFDVPARFDVDTFSAEFAGYRDEDGESLFRVVGLTIVEIRL